MPPRIPENRGAAPTLPLNALSGETSGLVLCAVEQRPPKLDLENYPHLPTAEVALTRAADYQVLLGEAR